MDKRQKLRFNTPNNSFDFRTDKLNIEVEPDSTIIIPKLPTFYEISEQINSNTDPLNFESSMGPDIDVFSNEKIENSEKTCEKGLETVEKNILFWEKYKHFGIYLIFTLSLLYFSSKPNDYENLLNEVKILRIKSFGNTPIIKMENVACLSRECLVKDHSDLYRYGFLMSSVTDPNSILESGMNCLALKSSSGFFIVKVKAGSKIGKIAFYHPEIANPSSPLKDFSVLINEKIFNFQFTGIGYQEFVFEAQEASEVKILFNSNHGENRYTSIYRIFVFSM